MLLPLSENKKKFLLKKTKKLQFDLYQMFEIDLRGILFVLGLDLFNDEA